MVVHRFANILIVFIMRYGLPIGRTPERQQRDKSISHTSYWVVDVLGRSVPRSTTSQLKILTASLQGED
jgi:hypothetical protein